jgi:glycerophosphoryl diester phosphodiesterase
MLLVAHRTPLSAAGCAALAAAGAGAFELDVQLIDGRLVVSHFVTLPRLPRWIEHDNWRFRLRNGRPFDAAFADVVRFVPADCRILLDPKLKQGADRVRLAEALAATVPAGERERFVVSTSHPGDLDRYRAAGFPTWRTIGNREHLHAVLAGGRLPDGGLSVRQSLLGDAELVARLRERASPVVAWTVNDARRARQLRDLGVDGLTTDRIAVLAQAVA